MPQVLRERLLAQGWATPPIMEVVVTEFLEVPQGYILPGIMGTWGISEL